MKSALARSIVVFIFCSMRIAGAEGVLDETDLVDAHAHIGRFEGYDLSLANLKKNLDENHVRFALVSNIDGADIPGVTADGDEVAINRETARVAAADPRLVPLAWAKPGARGANAKNIEPFLRDQGFRGIKLHPDFNHFDPASPSVAPYLELAAKYHVPAVFHCGRSPESSARALHAVARRYPNIPFVLYHMGFGTDHDEAIAEAKSARETHDAILFLETAQVELPSVLRAVREVGADRVLFGTDATYFGRDHYAFYAPVLRGLKKAIAPADFRKVIHDNASSLFRLSVKPH